MSEEDEIIKIIEAQMIKGVSRLKVTASENSRTSIQAFQQEHRSAIQPQL